MITPKAVEFVIFICCCALLPTFTDPKFIEVGLAVTDDADAALPAKIKSNNSITAIGNTKQIFFDIVWFCPLREGNYGTVKIYPGPWIFTTEGVYELPAESVYWSGGTREDRVRCCPLMYLPVMRS